MKGITKLKLLVLTATLALVVSGGVTGCATSPKGSGGSSTNSFDITKVTPVIRAAAYGGTIYVLRDHPEWAPKFDEAIKSLRVIESQDKLTFRTILDVVQSLNVPELRSKDARLAITGANIILLGYEDRMVALNETSTDNLHAIAKAIREGAELGKVAYTDPGINP